MLAIAVDPVSAAFGPGIELPAIGDFAHSTSLMGFIMNFIFIDTVCVLYISWDWRQCVSFHNKWGKITINLIWYPLPLSRRRIISFLYFLFGLLFFFMETGERAVQRWFSVHVISVKVVCYMALICCLLGAVQFSIRTPSIKCVCEGNGGAVNVIIGSPSNFGWCILFSARSLSTHF